MTLNEEFVSVKLKSFGYTYWILVGVSVLNDVDAVFRGNVLNVHYGEVMLYKVILEECRDLSVLGDTDTYHFLEGGHQLWN